ncbi:MAG: AEC family transporter [Planctomycetota bacterium]
MFELWPIIASVLGVFLVMGVGAACRQLKWLTAEADRTLANLTANVMLPAYFVHQFSKDGEIASVATAWQPPVYGFAMTVLGFCLALAIARTVGPWVGLRNDAAQRAFALSAGICNYGYIPLPLAEQFYPTAVIDLILHNVGVDMALWSVGIMIIASSSGRTWLKPLKSPPLWAVVVSILLSQIGLTKVVPAPVLSAVGAMGACAIPLGLLLSGAIIVDFLKDRDWFGDPRVILTAIVTRQAILPLLMLSAAAWLFQETDLRVVAMLQAAMPSAVFPIVLVKLYDRDSETALRVVLWTSLAGLILIPVWLAVGGWWLGIGS